MVLKRNKNMLHIFSRK